VREPPPEELRLRLGLSLEMFTAWPWMADHREATCCTDNEVTRRRTPTLHAPRAKQLLPVSRETASSHSCCDSSGWSASNNSVFLALYAPGLRLSGSWWMRSLQIVPPLDDPILSARLWSVCEAVAGA
jgi:hypothetical protein